MGKPRPTPNTLGDIYTSEEIERVRNASALTAAARDAILAQTKPGVSTDFLDEFAHEYIVSRGGYPSALGYRGFPKSICTSLNEVICHGIPDNTVIREGDILNIDVACYLDGMHGDTNATVAVGQVSEEAANLINRTEESLERAIRAVVPGRQSSVIGRAIESYAKRFGYGVVREFTGHGVGRAFHTGLIIPHYDTEEHSVELVPGMIFTIEPMLTLGSIDWDLWADGWTVTTKDKSLTAQFEHTVLVTESGAEVLTRSQDWRG
ncbi:MAG: hypothetical protein RL198_1025 [Actinomycetota bacterium]